MHCTECGKKLHRTQKFCVCGEPTQIAAALLESDPLSVVKSEKKTRVVKETSDDDEISIISPMKHTPTSIKDASSTPNSQSQARREVLENHGKQKIKDRGKRMGKPPSAYGMNPLSLQPPPKAERRIVSLWILEPGAILTKVSSAARQFQFNPKEEIPDLQEWIRSRIRDNMLWKQWSQEENYTENHERQAYIGIVDRNSPPAQIDSNVRTVGDILDQFDSRGQMVFVLPVDPGDTSKLSVQKQIKKRKSDNDIGVTGYDSDTEGSNTVDRKVKKARSFLNEKRTKKEKGGRKGKIAKEMERSLTPEAKAEAKAEGKKDEVVEVFDGVGYDDWNAEIEDETDNHDNLIQTLRKSSRSNKGVKKMSFENC